MTSAEHKKQRETGVCRTAARAFITQKSHKSAASFEAAPFA